MRAYDQTDDWALTLELLEPRLSASNERSEQAQLLRSAARLHLERGDNPESALACLCRALPIEPDNLAIEAAVKRLAEKTDRWVTVAASLRMAAEAMTEQAPARAAELRKAEGSIQETRLNDREAALDAYQAAAAAVRDDIEALEAIVRCGAMAGRWDLAASATVQAMRRPRSGQRIDHRQARGERRRGRRMG